MSQSSDFPSAPPSSGYPPYWPSPPGPYHAPAPGWGYPPPAPTPQPASWAARLGAYLIDAVIGLALYGVIAFAGGMGTVVVLESTAPDFLASTAGMFTAMSWIPLGLVAWFCYVWLSHARTGQTLGKYLLRIRVVSLRDGQPPSKAASAGRIGVHLGLGLVSCDLLRILDCLWPLWDEPHRQALHDKAVNTRVIAV